MAFTAKSVLDFINLGGSISVDASNYTINNLNDFVLMSKQKGVPFIIRNASRLTNNNIHDLILIRNDRLIIEI